MRLVKSIRIALTTLVLSGAAILHAHSATLKAEVTVYSHIVFAKDLFSNAGSLGEEPLFLSPDMGKSGSISAIRVADEARKIGLDQIDLNGVSLVTVHRPSRKVRPADIMELLEESVKAQLEESIDFEIVTSSLPDLIHGDPRVETALSIEELTLSGNDRRFQAIVRVPTYQNVRRLSVRGVITEMVMVAAPTRDLQRNEIVNPGDIEVTRRPARGIANTALTSADGLVGLAATRNLSQNTVLRPQDFAAPVLVQANDQVTITYAVPGLLLTVQGRALNSGALGDTINVRNLQSNRVISGRVLNSTEIIVEARNPLVASRLTPTSEEVQ